MNHVPPSPAKPRSETLQRTFEQSLEELERIVGELEGGQLSLRDALGNYEQGVRILTDCYKTLAAAERKVELLTVHEGAELRREAFDEQEMTLEQKQEARSRRRSATERSEAPSSSSSTSQSTSRRGPGPAEGQQVEDSHGDSAHESDVDEPGTLF